MSCYFTEASQLRGLLSHRPPPPTLLVLLYFSHNQARGVVQPYFEAAVEASKPIVKKAMEQTEPHRAKAGEVFQEYRGKFDDRVGAPATKVRLILCFLVHVFRKFFFFA